MTLFVICLPAVISLSPGSEFSDPEVIPYFRKLDPQIVKFQTIFRASADAEHDVLLVLGRRTPDSGWGKGDVLGFFLQDHGRPDRVYPMRLRKEDLGGFKIKVARYRPGELTLAFRPDYGSGARNLKFFFDVHSKTVSREVEYRPFRVSYVVEEGGVPHFIAEDGKQFLALRPNQDGGFDVLDGVAATRVLAGVPVSETRTPQELFRFVDRRPTGRVHFGTQSRFSIHIVENPSWGRIATGIEESASGKNHVYDLPQSTCTEFKVKRSKEYGLNGCRSEMMEEIGPYQVFEDRLWFAKSFYDAEGFGGVGGFGSFDPIERKYKLFSPPEVADWSGSALLVERDTVWIGLMHRGEYGDSSGGLLHWDRATQDVTRYGTDEFISRIVRYRGLLYLATEEGIAILRGGEVQKFIVDQTSSGLYQVLAP